MEEQMFRIKTLCANPNAGDISVPFKTPKCFLFDGRYGQYEMLNWAVTFFCDALMMINDKALAKRGIKG
jgi:hypothetical protein